MTSSGNKLPAHNATDPKCKCCGTVIEYNSEGYRWGLCITCTEATNRFLVLRRENLQSRGLIKK